MKYDCVVVGGGASGLMLAAMMKVNNGVIVESTAAAGNKLMLTGGGRCNVTHAGSIKDFVDCYDEAGRALRKNLYKHNNIEMVNWLESIGVPCVVEDDKYYPASMKASDVRDALVHAAKNNGWTFKYNHKIQSVTDLPESDHIVIATGGISTSVYMSFFEPLISGRCIVASTTAFRPPTCVTRTDGVRRP